MKGFIQDLYKKDRTLVLFLFAFMILQPFLDVRTFFENENLQLFGFTIPTLVRCVGIFMIFLLSLRHIKKDKDHEFYCFYFLGLGTYIIFHHFVAQKELIIPNSYSYSVFTEIFYMLRMVFPFIIMYVSKYTKFTYHTFINVVVCSSAIISLVIVISNLLYISPLSYVVGYDHNFYNLIDWFTIGTKADYYELYTSKGWFYMANQLGGLMVLLLPLNYYDFIKKPRFINVLSSVLLSISMLMLGTRVSSFGMILITLTMGIVALFFFFVFKTVRKRNLLMYCVFCVFITGLFMIAPIHNRIYGYGEVENLEVELSDIEQNIKIENMKEDFVIHNYDERKIQKVYIYKLYPVKHDVDFWYDFIINNTSFVVENREMQKNITMRIASLNPNFMYDLFGYSFSRFRNGEMYIENDFLVHYFSIGIFGIVFLLCPWFVIMLKGTYSLIKNKFKQFDFLTCTILFSMAICIGASFMSGHIMDELIVTLYLGFIGGFLLRYIKEENTNA